MQLKLTVQKELQMSAAKAGMTVGQLRVAFSAPQATAGGVPRWHVFGKVTPNSNHYNVVAQCVCVCKRERERERERALFFTIVI